MHYKNKTLISILLLAFLFSCKSQQVVQKQPAELVVEEKGPDIAELRAKYLGRRYWVGDDVYVFEMKSTWDRKLLVSYESGAIASNDLHQNAFQRAQEQVQRRFLTEALDLLIQARMGYQDAEMLSGILAGGKLQAEIPEPVLIDQEVLDSDDLKLTWVYEKENLRQSFNLSLEKNPESTP